MSLNEKFLAAKQELDAKREMPKLPKLPFAVAMIYGNNVAGKLNADETLFTAIDGTRYLANVIVVHHRYPTLTEMKKMYNFLC